MYGFYHVSFDCHCIFFCPEEALFLFLQCCLFHALCYPKMTDSQVKKKKKKTGKKSGKKRSKRERSKNWNNTQISTVPLQMCFHVHDLPLDLSCQMRQTITTTLKLSWQWRYLISRGDGCLVMKRTCIKTHGTCRMR